VHRVVIVGCGFGGLFAAKALRRAPVEVVVIDRTNHHLFQALLYQVATGVLSEGDIAPPIRDVLRRQRNTKVVLGEVVDVDVERREVMIDTLGDATTLVYDSLIVATGASQSYFGHDEYALDAPGMKTIDDALELRGRIFGAFELAELEPDAAAREPWLTFAIVGAGPTGVELAGQIAELSRRALTANYRRFDPADSRIVLLDAVDTVLPSFPERLRKRARRDLERLGVELRLGSRVIGVDETGVDVDGGRIEARTKIWAAGVQASPLGRLLAQRAGATVDRSGRVQVQNDCSLPGHPELFVVGDLMALDGLPGVAEVAIQSGHHAATTIARRLRARPVEPFHYRDLGTMATIARFRAVVSIGRLQITGFIGWLMWLVVHVTFLTGFKNRLAALANWAVAFLGRGRRQRTITKQQVLARARARTRRHAMSTPAEIRLAEQTGLALASTLIPISSRSASRSASQLHTTENRGVPAVKTGLANGRIRAAPGAARVCLIRRPTPRGSAAHVDAHGGIVTLSGLVDLAAQRDRAERVALRVGVTQVHNKLQILLLVSADEVAERVTDAIGTDAIVGADRIAVSVRDNDVTLTGTVRSPRHRLAALAAAAGARGVADVHDRLTVRAYP
jgi:NADH:quinone reductase (non-electrogenic)